MIGYQVIQNAKCSKINEIGLKQKQRRRRRWSAYKYRTHLYDNFRRQRLVLSTVDLLISLSASPRLVFHSTKLKKQTKERLTNTIPWASTHPNQLFSLQTPSSINQISFFLLLLLLFVVASITAHHHQQQQQQKTWFFS